ncbi:MAG: hypothetical protein HY721_01080 [Planctomycetes bacterium]|nr:hypothetical protein [Planctomycetota bacterium]
MKAHVARFVARFVVRCVVASLAALLFAVVPWTIWSRWSTARLERALAGLRAAGLPTEVSEVLSEPVPSHENAAALYLAAVEVVQGLASLPADPIPQVSKETRELFPLAGAALDLARRAGELPRCRYPRAPVAGPDGGATALQYRHFMQLARLLAASAIVQSEAGDLDGAVEDLRALFRAAGSLRQEPTLLDQIVRMTVTGIGLSALEAVLPRCPSATAALARVDPDPIRGATAGAIRSEVAWLLSTVLPVVAGEKEWQGDPGSFGGGVFGMLISSGLLGPYFKYDVSLYVDSLCKYAGVFEKPYPEAIPLARQTEAEAERSAGYLMRLVVVKIAGIVEREAEVASRLQLARVAAACLDHWKSTGGFPESLPALVEARALEDPLTGEPFELRRRDGGVVLASAGGGKVTWELR